MTMKRLLRKAVGQRWLVMLGHYSPIPIAVAVVVSRVVAEVTRRYTDAYLVIAVMAVLFLAFVVHGSAICTRGGCAVMFADPHLRERRRWPLWWVHHQFRSRVTWGLMVAYLVTTATGHPVVTIPVLLALGVLAWWAGRWHSRLRPWCPWCSGGGRGPGEQAGHSPIMGRGVNRS